MSMCDMVCLCVDFSGACVVMYVDVSGVWCACVGICGVCMYV